jgi:hypothetical protein
MTSAANPSETEIDATAAITPEPTRSHDTNALSFELPMSLSDQTMHVFALKDDGPNEFNLVISHAKVDKKVSLANFAEQISSELKRAMPLFDLQHQVLTQVDGSPAVELLYNWSNKGLPMQQRQTIVLVQSSLDDDAPEALMIAATCMKSFSTHWRSTYERMLASIKLRKPWPPKSEQVDGTQDAEPRYGFALNGNTLRVLKSRDDFPALIGTTPSQVNAWKLYRHDGQAIQVIWEPTQASGPFGLLRSSPKSYELTDVESENIRGPLQYRLATIDHVMGELNSLLDVKNYLDRQVQAAKEGAVNA